MQIKRIILTLLLLAGISTASAQSWLDILKNVAGDTATQLLDELTGGAVTEAAIVGKWSYQQPAVKLQSDNVLSNLGGSAIESTIVPKLQKGYSMAGIIAGSMSFTFNEDKSFSAQIARRTLNGTYEYDSSTHAITLSFSSILKATKLTGYAYLDGSELQLVFPVTKLVEWVKSLSRQISQLERAAALLDNYKEVYLGFGFTKE